MFPVRNSRPATGSTQLTVLVKAAHSRRYRTLRSISTNAAGYWAFTSHSGGELWRVRWRSPQGVTYEGPPIRAH